MIIRLNELILLIVFLLKLHSVFSDDVDNEVDDVKDSVEISDDQKGVGNVSESITSIKLSTSTPSSRASSPLRHIQVGGIFGCSWPEDYVQRFQFCAKQSGLEFENDSMIENVQFGVLNREITSELMTKCTKEDLNSCVRNVDEEDLQSFVNKWQHSQEEYNKFESCLQKNTEAMNKLCGGDSELSRVISGAAGLQLNLLNILSQMNVQSRRADLNVSNECLDRVTQAVHITSALYIASEHYMGNSVLCWDVVHQRCESHCAAFAQELTCLAAACPSVPMETFQKFGIWQWYFLNSDSARQSCMIQSDSCKVRSGENKDSTTGAKSLLNVETWKNKMKEAKDELEMTFQLPIETILAIAIATFSALLVSITIICMWRYGILCSHKKSNNTRQYSRLGTGSEEQTMLTTAIDMDD